MRRKVTLNLDERFIRAMDDERGDVPRSRWIERQRSPLTAHRELEGLHGEEAHAALGAIEKTRSPAIRPESHIPEGTDRTTAFLRATQRNFTE